MAAATDYQSLLSAANVPCYINQPPGIQQVLELALLQIIAINGVSGGGGGAVSVFSGNYAGGKPTQTPTTTAALAYDTSNGTLWQWNGTSWN